MRRSKRYDHTTTTSLATTHKPSKVIEHRDLLSRPLAQAEIQHLLSSQGLISSSCSQEQELNFKRLEPFNQKWEIPEFPRLLRRTQGRAVLIQLGQGFSMFFPGLKEWQILFLQTQYCSKRVFFIHQDILTLGYGILSAFALTKLSPG